MLTDTIHVPGVVKEKSATGDKFSGAGAKLSAVIDDFSTLLGECFPKQFTPEFETSLKANPEGLKAALSAPLQALSPTATRDDVAFAASAFMARKILPSPPGDPLPAYIAKMGRYQTLNSDFAAKAATVVSELFPRGWDSRYVAYCGRALPSAGASFERSRKNGGAREEIKSEMSRSEFVRACSTGIGIEMLPTRRVSLVNDDGKTRIVSIATAKQSVLSPLHHLLYDTISRRKCFLKGEATMNSFKEFSRTEGEVFVSGDYEAATDNFNNLHSEFILEQIFRNCSSIPKQVQKLALCSLTGQLETTTGRHPQVAAQLMGNLLSFPLLCLTNYIALKMAIDRPVPLRINGDDIVFRCTLEEFETWKRVVTDAGLTLSLGKTLVHSRYFSLNSCFFEARRERKPSRVPIIRAKSIYAPLKSGHGSALKARILSAFTGGLGYRKGHVRTHILRFHHKAVSAIGCSLNRGLGVRVYHPELVKSGLLSRELHYLQAPAGVDKPRRVVLSRPSKKGEESLEELGGVTEGWVNVPTRRMGQVRAREYSRLWGEHCLAYAWRSGVGTGIDDVEPVRYGFAENHWPMWQVRLMRQSRRGLSRLCSYFTKRNPTVKRFLYGKGGTAIKPSMVRVPVEEVGHLVPVSVKEMFGPPRATVNA
jgi:hypothetical protein